MNRRDFLKISAAAAASLALGCSPGALFRRRPNLILIVSDTLRADHLRCYGSPLPLSPVVDALAGRGIVFADVTTSAPITGAAHATLMTGTYQTRHTVTDNFGHLRDDLVTLAEVLKNAKYETAAFVSSNVLKPEHVYGFARGFGLYNDELPAVERNRPDSYYTDARDTTAAAIEWVGRRHSAPFFLWVHYLEPHGPYEVPDPALLKEIRSVPQVPSEPRVLPLGADNYHPGGIPPYQVLGQERDPREYRRRYAARVGYMDEHVGKLLEAVGRLRLTENTLIAFSSDHGELLGEHDYYFMHGITVLQPVVSIPLILAGPGTKPGTRVTVPVSNADIMPTLLDLLGVSSRHAASQVQGRSLAPMLRGESDQARPLFCLVKRTREWCVRLGHLKYTKSDHPNTGRDGLFDLSADPQERQDISSARPDDAAGVAKHLEQFRSENPRVLEGSSTKAAPPLSDAEKQRLKALGYL